MYIDIQLSATPDDNAWVLGWGVVQIPSQDLDSLFRNELEAQLKAHLLGPEYQVYYGSYCEENCQFIPIADLQTYFSTTIIEFLNKMGKDCVN